MLCLYSKHHERCDSCDWESCVNCFFTKSVLLITSPTVLTPQKTNLRTSNAVKIKLLAPLGKKVCEIFHELGLLNTSHKVCYFLPRNLLLD
jgi:hypothetical protein